MVKERALLALGPLVGAVLLLIGIFAGFGKGFFVVCAVGAISFAVVAPMLHMVLSQTLLRNWEEWVSSVAALMIVAACLAFAYHEAGLVLVPTRP
jgi:hypothetical protein